MISAETLQYKDIVQLLKDKQDEIFEGKKFKKINSREIGYFTIKIASMFYPQLKDLIPFLGKDLQMKSIPYEY